MAQVSELVDRFEDFLHRYYNDEIKHLAKNYPQEQKSLEVDWQDLYRYDPDLADEYLDYPDQFHEAAEEALRLYELPIDVSFGQAHVRIKNLTEKTPISTIDSSDLNRLISLTGTVESANTTESRWQEVVFTCQRCGTETVVPQTESHGGDDIQEPHQCESCERSGPFRVDAEKSTFVDRQKFELRETPVGNRMGDDIETITIFLEDDLAGEVSPGDAVTVVGVLRPTEPGEYTSASIADKYVDALSLEFPDLLSEVEITQEDQKNILQLAGLPNIYEQMVSSLAPSVYGYETEKLALVLQLFGGVAKELPDGTRIRGNIHTFLIGDPGCGKTHLLEAQTRLAPKALHTNGEQTTSAGLTASAERTKGGGSAFELKAGPVVLADNGHVTIDNLDDMRAEYRSALHETMNKQTVSASKGDVNTRLKARTAITATANPKYGRFDQYEPLGEQIDMDPKLISRFDLLFTVSDHPDEQKDAKLAEHILQTNYAGELHAHHEQNKAPNTSEEEIKQESEPVLPKIDPDLFRKYIAYSRRNCFPTMTEEAREAIRDFYVDLRSKGTDEDAPVPVTARKLESLVRLAEASARVRLSDEVTREDADRVINIVKSCLQDIGIDPETGEFDADVVETGSSKEQGEPKKRVEKLVSEVEDMFEDGAPVNEVLNRAGEVGLTPDKVEHCLDKLKQKGEVYQPSADHLRTT